MNKLVSKNPIQRFKQGKKIQKFGEAGKFPLKNSSIGIKRPSLDIPKINNLPLPSAVENYTPTFSAEDKKNYALWKAKKAAEEERAKSDYRRALENAYYSQYSFMKGRTRQRTPEEQQKWENEVQRQANIQKQTKTQDNTKPKKTSVNNIWIKEFNRHPEITNVREVQKKLIELGLLNDRFGADGKWGKNTEAAYQKYLSLKNIPVYEKSETPSVAAMAGIYTEENKPLYQRIRFKQGGQLPSRNVIERFKSKINKN